jgi:protoheme IX farnesyltransferase
VAFDQLESSLETSAASELALSSVSAWTRVRAYVDLTKPRILVMLVFTALCGMMVALGHLPPFVKAVECIVLLALTTGGSAALNMWYDRDIDVLMQRTKRRPLPMGLVHPRSALIFGISLIVIGCVGLYVLVNPLTCFLTFLGAVYYVVIYTFWLKRKTPQNIVIGGGAGAFPPLIGAAAVVGYIPVSAILLFLTVFLWTPPHFWSLALYRNSDYQAANIPMMPTVRGARSTKWQSFSYAWLLTACVVWLGFQLHNTAVFLPIAGLLCAVFLVFLWRALREQDHVFVWARRSFFFSLLFLTAIFTLAALVSVL